MKRRKTIFIILIQFAIGGLIASNPKSIVKELKFDAVQMDYEEGIRNVVDIYHILEDNRGIIWLGSTKGLYRFNGSSAIDITSRINDQQGNLVASSWITDIAKDEFNRIWFGTTLGLYVYDQNTDKCTSIILESKGNVSPENSYISNIAIKNNSVFVGTRDGLYEVNMANMETIGSYMTNGATYDDKGTESKILTINTNVSDTELWFTSKIGVHQMELKTHQLDTFSMGGDIEKYYHYFLNGIAKNGKIVFADYKNGIVEFDMAAKTFKIINISSNEWNRTKSIVNLEDDLYLLNAEKRGIAVYDATSGKSLWMESSGNIKQGFYNITKDSQGFLWLATNGQLFRSNMSFSESLVTKPSYLDIGNAFANGRKLNNLLGETETLYLNHKENNLQVNFGLTNSYLYNDLTYQYQIDNEDWSNIIDENKLNIFDLPAGNHHMIIKAMNEEVELASTSVSINVHRPFTSSPLFFALIALSLFGLASGVYFYNKKQYEKAAKIKSKYETRLATLESQALRSQINPHFIFNTLNSIKYYSIEKSPEETSDFISSFSTLIRRILENSKKNLITLHEEIETLRNYTEIEALRFHERFDVEYNVDSDIEIERFLIPPMIIQPFIENAIWHGLMHKSGNRKLKINIKRKGIGVVCEIIDNGIGREASNALKTNDRHKSSLGMKITKERMQIINARNLTNNSFEIEDMVQLDGTSAGTKVSIYFLPKENN